MHLTRSLRLHFLALVLAGTAALASEAPRPWPPDAFLPVTAERIAALPAAERPAWQAYLAKSRELAGHVPARDLVDHSATKPLPGGPIGSSYSKGVKLGAPAAWYETEEGAHDCRPCCELADTPSAAG